MHKTAIRIDENLARQAREVLGTPTLTATVNGALREVVDRARIQRFLDRMHQHRGLELDDPDVLDNAWR